MYKKIVKYVSFFYVRNITAIFVGCVDDSILYWLNFTIICTGSCAATVLVGISVSNCRRE